MKSYRKDILLLFEKVLPWDKLAGANILVSGATGLIGGCLIDTLMINPHRNYQVYALGRNEERAANRFREYINDTSFHFVRHDVIEPLNINIDFDYIVHAASGSSPYFFANSPVEVIKSNISGVDNLIAYGVNHGLKRFLYVSSGEIYGEGDGRVFTEDYSGYVNCTTPRACYPSSKRAAETLCVSYADEYGVDVVIARPCHIYGPHFTNQDNRVFAQFIRNVLHDEDVVMKSNGEQFRSWCYVVDCVNALLHILLKGKCGEAYNIADADSNVSIREFAEIIAEIGGKRVVIDAPVDDEKKGYNVVSKSIFSIEKLERLGWKAKNHLHEGLIHTIEECELL